MTVKIDPAYMKQTLKNTEWTIKKGQSRETGNIWYTRRRKSQHNSCWTQLYANINKTCFILQTIGGKDEPNIVIMRKPIKFCYKKYIYM